MSIEIIRILIKIGIFLSIGFSCIIFYKIIQEIGTKTGNIEEKTKQAIDKTIKKSGSMNRQKQKLSELGIMYRVHDYNLNPSWYILVRCAIGVCVTLIVYLLSNDFLLSLIGIPVGYIATEFIFKRLNNQDNKDIIMDLYNTYANLKIQMDAGVYIVDSIEYSYKNATHPRYKEALGELILNFSDKTIPMTDAIEIFKHRFNSKEINKLSALLHSCLIYNASKAYTKDIMNEIQSIILASTLSSEHDIETKADMIKFALFAILILIVVFSVASGFGDMTSF